MPNLRDRWRDRRALDADDPGAPPGYLLDPDDNRTHDFPPVEVPYERWDPNPVDQLARGAGER